MAIGLLAACLVQAAEFSVTCQDSSGSVTSTGPSATCNLNETSAAIQTSEEFSPSVFYISWAADAQIYAFNTALHPVGAMASTDAFFLLPPVAPGDVLKVDLSAFSRGNGSPSFEVELQGGSVSIPLLLPSMFPSGCFEYLGCQKHISTTAAVSQYSIHIVSSLSIFDLSGPVGFLNSSSFAVSVFQPDGVTPGEFVPEPAPVFLVAAGLLLGIQRLKSTAAGSAP